MLHSLINLFRVLHDGFVAGSRLTKEAVAVLFHHPSLLIPLLSVWVLSSILLLYAVYFFIWEAYSVGTQAMVMFLVVYIMSALLLTATAIQVVVIEQIETSQRASFGRAVGLVVTRYALTVLLLSVFYAIIWGLLVMLQSLFSRRRSSAADDLSFRTAYGTISGLGRSSSVSGSMLEVMKKGTRFLFFLIIPAIVWENRRIVKAVTRAFSVLDKRVVELASAFLFSEFVAVVLFLPPAILWIAQETEVLRVSTTGWMVLLVYEGLVWSFVVYVEQMFLANLFLWHKKWEVVQQQAIEKGTAIPALLDVPQPSLLDEVPDLLLRTHFKL